MRIKNFIIGTDKLISLDFSSLTLSIIMKYQDAEGRGQTFYYSSSRAVIRNYCRCFSEVPSPYTYSRPYTYRPSYVPLSPTEYGYRAVHEIGKNITISWMDGKV